MSGLHVSPTSSQLNEFMGTMYPLPCRVQAWASRLKRQLQPRTKNKTKKQKTKKDIPRNSKSVVQPLVDSMILQDIAFPVTRSLQY